MTQREETWRDSAVCADIPKAWFFVDSGELYSAPVLDACARCPVWEPCLMDALSDRNTVEHGYRAGTVPRTRMRMVSEPQFLREFVSARKRFRAAPVVSRSYKSVRSRRRAERRDANERAELLVLRARRLLNTYPEAHT